MKTPEKRKPENRIKINVSNKCNFKLLRLHKFVVKIIERHNQGHSDGKESVNFPQLFPQFHLFLIFCNSVVIVTDSEFHWTTSILESSKKPSCYRHHRHLQKGGASRRDNKKSGVRFIFVITGKITHLN